MAHHDGDLCGLFCVGCDDPIIVLFLLYKTYGAGVFILARALIGVKLLTWFFEIALHRFSQFRCRIIVINAFLWGEHMRLMFCCSFTHVTILPFLDQMPWHQIFLGLHNAYDYDSMN